MNLSKILADAKGLIKGISPIIGGEDDKKKKVYKTQAEINEANEVARRLGRKANLLSANELRVADKVGDPVIEMVDLEGRPVTGLTKTNKLATTLPPGMTINDIKSEQGVYWYDDPATGDPIDVDPQAIFAKYGRKKNQSELSGDIEAIKAKLNTGIFGGTTKVPIR